MRPEYAFSKDMWGKHPEDLSKGYTSIVHHPDGTKEMTDYHPLPDARSLAPDVRRYFPDADAVNTALRGLIALVLAKQRARRRSVRQAEKG